MNGTDEPLLAACEEAMVRQTRLVVGEDLPADEQAQLAQHLASCAACRRLQAELAHSDQTLRATYAGTHASAGFAASVMAALPAALEPQPQTVQRAAPAGPRVFAAGPHPRRNWAKLGALAAGLAASVALILAIASGGLFPRGGTGIAIKGPNRLLDANGQPVRQLKVGEVYTVQDTTVLALPKNAGLLKLQPGTEFQLQPSANSGQDVQLRSGDLYVWGEDDQRPVRVASPSFDATLHKGDFFVADGGDDDPTGVVIVFSGRAQVAFEQETMPLRAGQIFVSMGRDDWAVTQTIELNAAMEAVVAAPAPPQEDLAALRREYEARVRGYQRELKVLERQVREETNAQRRAELRARQQLVATYRDAHQRRLDSLWQAMPFEAIRRGLGGHIGDPTKWL